MSRTYFCCWACHSCIWEAWPSIGAPWRASYSQLGGDEPFQISRHNESMLLWISLLLARRLSVIHANIFYPFSCPRSCIAICSPCNSYLRKQAWCRKDKFCIHTKRCLRTAPCRQDETMYDKHPKCLSGGLGISCHHMPNASIAVSTELLESDRTRRPRYVTCSALSVWWASATGKITIVVCAVRQLEFDMQEVGVGVKATCITLDYHQSRLRLGNFQSAIASTSGVMEEIVSSCGNGTSRTSDHSLRRCATSL